MTTEPAKEPKWLRPLQAARRLGVSLSYIYRLSQTGKLPFYHIGGCRVYCVEELDALPQRQEPPKEPTRE